MTTRRLDMVTPEFDAGQDLPPSDLSRREFLYYGAAALAFTSSALAGCTRAPAEKIIPYRVQPNGIVPGRAQHYASASTLDGYATGIVVESHEGRPTKIEGNSQHPASLGASSALEQALLIELYDPRRLRSVMRFGAPAADADLLAALRQAVERAKGGRGLHLVLGPTSSPLLSEQLSRLRDALPELTVHFHAPLSRSAVWQGARAAFDATLETQVDLGRADVVVALASDALATGPDHLALARGFAERRRMSSARDPMNRLYVVESAMSVTGGMADHRLALRPSQIPAFAVALLREIALRLGAEAPPEILRELKESRLDVGQPRDFVRAVAGDLLRQRGRGVVLVGDQQPAVVHASAHALNVLLGNAGPVTRYAASVVVESGSAAFGSLATLRDALVNDAVDALIVLDADIVYGSAADLGLGALLARAKESIYFGLFENATSAACHWQAPSAHVLESWLDTRALDGTVSLVQPLIQPLYGGRTTSEVLSLLLEVERSAHDLLKDFWGTGDRSDFAAFWETALSAGVVEGSATPIVPTPELRWDFLSEAAQLVPFDDGIELNLVPDSRIYDGRFANNPWLLELPCPITKLTWGNAALISPELAARLGLESGDVVGLEVRGRTLEVPALLVPGHADRTVSLALGWGQHGVEGPIGANAFTLLPNTPSPFETVHVRRSGRREELAITQGSMTLGQFESSVLLSATLEEYRKAGSIGLEQRKTPLSLYASDAKHEKRQWGMTIDLNACTGCSACVIACQAENNVPTVGKNGVLKHREMHWLRVDRYVSGSGAASRVLVQPMACQHCEKAPCEYVCPTAATVHSSDGLNQMVYNRCVGTRFCSNNCPYKVRRFNWFDYHQDDRSPRELAQNPEVTVRDRGVMEKCSYCVQRIRKAEILARTQGRALADGDVRTACEQACPTHAIAFGDINDATSEVSRLRRSDRAFRVLNDLGTVPRTVYLAKLTNPNPELT